MRRQIILLIVFLFGYSLILGGNGTDEVTDTTIDPLWNETWDNNTSENPITTNQETTNSTSSPLNATNSPPETTLDPLYNETNDYNTTTPEGPPFNGTGSPTSSSSLNVGPEANKRIDDGQRFDTASFIGGIILAIGVLALGFFLFKVYQSRKGNRAEYNNI